MDIYNPALPLPTGNVPAWAHVLRHIAGNGGWVWADFFDLDGYGPIRDELINLGFIEAAEHGQPAYELTDAGRAWCRDSGS
jgi:hypothetical protein